MSSLYLSFYLFIINNGKFLGGPVDGPLHLGPVTRTDSMCMSCNESGVSRGEV
jgi:hypothetical protein